MAYHDAQSFFVEGDEMVPEHHRPRLVDQAKEYARARQRMMAGELSRLLCEEYLEDIMQHLRTMEDETLPDVTLIDLQQEIEWYMRKYLIDFLIEAHGAFALLPETLFLAVNLLDRYCSKRVVFKQHYQLVGCATLLIAAKYGDKKERVPSIAELNNMCCGLYDAGMFTQMEMHVLNTLEWSIGHPTVDFFSQLIVTNEQDDAVVAHMAAYLCEMALYHRDFVSTKPSTMARASLALARAMLERPEVSDSEWDSDTTRTVMTLSLYIRQPSAILQRKYTAPQHMNVATLLVEFLERHDAANQTPLAPPSPPSDAYAAKAAGLLSTPQKATHPHGSMAADGYPTPPITPDDANFRHDPTASLYQRQCPSTPTPPSQWPSYAPPHERHLYPQSEREHYQQSVRQPATYGGMH